MFNNWASDPEVTKYLMWSPHKNISETANILKKWVEEYGNKKIYNWAIVLKDKNELIGNISIVDLNEKLRSVHFGFCIGKKWWNKGIASEALSFLIDFFFKDIKINRVESRHDPRNSGSGKVMKKCGMLYEGTIRQGDWNNKGICDYTIYGITLDDYI